jgi:tRNA U34 2-thiouridine synthase MnmA/TrmU
MAPKGVLTFTVELLKGGGIFRPGQIRWCVQRVDSRNYVLFEMDRKNFWAGVVENGRRFERIKSPHGLDKQKAFTVQVEIASGEVVTKVRVGDEWRVIDTFSEPARDFTEGKFGFLIQGNDEVAISDFRFTPR